MAAPMPLEAPVTRATLLASFWELAEDMGVIDYLLLVMSWDLTEKGGLRAKERRSAGGETAVDQQVVAGDEGGAGRAQPQHGGSDFRGCANAAERMERGVSLARVGLALAEERLEARRADASGRNAVHAHALRGKLECGGFRETDHGM